MANNEDSNENLYAHILALQATLTSESHRTTVSDVLRLLSEPLSLLNLLPSDDIYSEWSGERADLWNCLKLIESLAWQKQLRFLLEHVVVDWLTALSGQQQRDLFEPYFIPLKRIGEEVDTLRIKRRMAFASLQAITGLFAETSAALRNGDDVRFHSLLVLTTTSFLERLLRQYDIVDFYQALFNLEVHDTTDMLKIQKLKKMEWKDFVVMLCSIPTRVANMIGGDWSARKDDTLLNDVPFFHNLSLQTENAIWVFSRKILMGDHNAKNLAFALGELIGKICRLGYAKTFIQAVHKDLENHLHSNLFSSSSISYHTIFQMITLTYLQPSDLTHLLTAYLTYMDTHILSLVNVYESGSSRRTFRRIAQTLHGMLGSSSREDGNEIITRLIEDKFLLGGKAGWSVGVARVLVCWLCWDMSEEHRESIEEHVLEVLKRIFEIWSDPTFVKRGSWDQQIYITSILLLLAGHISQSTLRSSFVTGEVMRGVGSWLETTDQQCRKLGIVLCQYHMTAEVLSSLTDLTGNVLDFGILEPEKDEEILRLKMLVEIGDGITRTDDDVEEFSVQENIETSNGETPQATLVDDEESVKEIQKVMKHDDDDPDAPMVIRYSDDIRSDETSSESDLEPYPMEEEEEVEDIFTGKEKIGKPVYIVNLISYLKASDDPEKLDIGLKTAEELIRRKTGIGFEIEENAIELARSLLALENNYEFEDFFEKREKALVSLVVAVPDQIPPYLCEKFYDKNYSISQRTSMLTALAVGARELAEWADNQDISKKTNTKPYTLDTLTTEIQTSLKSTATESMSITRSSVRIFSRKSAIEAARPKPQVNRFGKYAARYFFYPLITGWWEGMRGGLTEKGYISVARESVLLGKLVSTLGVLLYCATNANEIVRMAREFWDFALALRHHEYGKSIASIRNIQGGSGIIGPENSILSALLFGVTVVVTMSVKPDRKLVDEFGRELFETREWITDVLNNSQDPKIQVQCAGLVIRLREVMEEYQRQLFGDTLPI